MSAGHQSCSISCLMHLTTKAFLMVVNFLTDFSSFILKTYSIHVQKKDIFVNVLTFTSESIVTCGHLQEQEIFVLLFLTICLFPL